MADPEHRASLIPVSPGRPKAITIITARTIYPSPDSQASKRMK